MAVIYINVHSFLKKSGVSLEIEKLVEADIEIKIDINFRHTFYFSQITCCKILKCSYVTILYKHKKTNNDFQKM